MKRIVVLLVALAVSTQLFAESGIADRKLIAGVYDFATVPSDTWALLDTSFTAVNAVSDQYVFTGSFIVKILVGMSRYDFTCSITKENGDINVALSDMCSYGCDRSGKMVKKGSKYKTLARVSNEYAANMKTEIETRLSSWSDEEYTQKLNAAVTSPVILNCVANNSALVFKKFLSDFEVIGRPITVKINVTKVDEAPNYAEGYAYYVAGNALRGYRIGEFGIHYPEYATLMVYTNNDAVISLTPGNSDILMGTGEEGDEYEVKGTVRDVSRLNTGGLSIIQVNE